MSNSKKDAHTRIDIDAEIARIIENGGYTAEQRIRTVQATIDIALARSYHVVETGLQQGALTWPAMAERMQAILKNLEDRGGTASNPVNMHIHFEPYGQTDNTQVRESVGQLETASETAIVSSPE